MKFYEVDFDDGEPPSYFVNLTEAKRHARDNTDKGDTIEIQTIEVGNLTKATVLNILNRQQFVLERETVATVKGAFEVEENPFGDL